MIFSILRASAVCAISIILVAGCVGAPGGARSAVFAGTVAGPVGGIVNSIAVVSRYRASSEQKASALRIARMTAKRRENSPKKTRYISVPVKTVAKSSKPSNPAVKKPAAQVMVYDTKKDTLVSDKVFGLSEKPKRSELLEFDTYFTRYTD